MENGYIIGAIMLITLLFALFITELIDKSHNEKIPESEETAEKEG